MRAVNKRRWVVVLSLLLILGTGGYGSICYLIYKHQDRMIYFPSNVIEQDPGQAGLAYEEFEVEVEPGVKLSGWIVENDLEAPWVLHFHGNAGNISHRVDHLAFLSELGFNGVVFDYRGYGQSSGQPSEEGLVADGLAVVKYLQEKRAVDPRFLVYWGESLGGGVAAAVALKKPPRALVLQSTFTSVTDMAAETYPFLPVRWLARTKLPTVDRIPTFLFPKMIVHSQADFTIPYRHGQKLYQAALEPKKFFQTTGDHNTSVLEQGDEFKAAFQAFVQSAVPQEH